MSLIKGKVNRTWSSAVSKHTISNDYNMIWNQLTKHWRVIERKIFSEKEERERGGERSYRRDYKTNCSFPFVSFKAAL